jgi:hypothetical protein
MHDSLNGYDGREVGAGGASDARSALLWPMVDSEDEFRQREADRLAQMPAYRAVPADRLAIVLDEIAWLYRVFLACLAERRELSPPEVGHIEGIGHSRARQGIPLEGPPFEADPHAGSARFGADTATPAGPDRSWSPPRTSAG